MIRLLIFSIIFLAPIFSMAQSISGRVVDSDGRALPGVNVYIKDSTLGAASNYNGAYRIENASKGQFILMASMIGFRTFEQEIEISSSDLIVDIKLQPITLQSGEVVVAGSRSGQSSMLSPVSVSFLSQVDLEQRNIFTLDEALAYVPGVQMAGTQINIRGSSGFTYGVGSRVMVLVDGVPILSPDAGDVKMDGLPFAQVERVEVVKGPGSALYGGGALGGVINLTTKPYPEKLELSVRTFQGFYEPFRHAQWRSNLPDGNSWKPFQGASFTVASKLGERFGFWINGVYRGDEGWLEHNAFYGGEVFSKVGYQGPKGSKFDVFLGAKVFRREQFIYWNGLDDVLSVGRIRLGSSETRGQQEGLNEMYSIQPIWNWVITPEQLLTVRARGLALILRTYRSDGTLRDRSDQGIGARYGSDVQYTYTPSKQSMFILGGSFDANVAESDYFFGVDSVAMRNQPEFGLYSQLQHDVSESVTATVGLRFDAYAIDTQNLENRLSPKVNLSWQIASETVMRASYGWGFRVPSVAERFVANRDFIPLEPNLLLKPELSTGYEIGFKHIFQGNWFALQADIAGFWNDYQDLVEPLFVPDLGAFQFQNISNARIRGVEMQLEFYPYSEFFYIRGGVTLLESFDRERRQELVFRSNQQVQTSFGLKPIKGMDLGADFRFFSEPNRLDSDFSRFVPDADVAVATRVLDARANYTFMIGGKLELTAGFVVRNAMQYAYLERPAFMAAPRSYQGQVQLTF